MIFVLFLRRKLLWQESHHYESADRRQTVTKMGYWNIVSKTHHTDGPCMGCWHLEGGKNQTTTEVTHHWNLKQQLLSAFFHTKHQLLKQLNFAQIWKMGGWANVFLQGSRFFRGFSCESHCYPSAEVLEVNVEDWTKVLQDTNCKR